MIQYYFLYHSIGLQPFQVNFYFTSNVIGSFSKRFLSEVVPYALIFYLLYYTRNKWIKIALITVFELIFIINILMMGFYHITRSNFQFYILEGFNFNIILSFLTPLLILSFALVFIAMTVMAYYLWKIKNRGKKVWLFKKYLFITLLIALTVWSPFIPMQYTNHKSIFQLDSVTKNFYRTIDLENSGFTILLGEFRHHFSPKTLVFQKLTEDDKKSIKSLKLNEHLTQDFPNPPKKIILVVVESLNQQFLSYYNKDINGSTKNIDNLIENYPHIDEFYPSGPYTLQGLSAMLCGHTNSRQVQHEINYKCVPKMLSEIGFNDIFIRGASRYYASENIHFNKFGFNEIFAKEEFDKKFPEFKDERPDLYNTWGFSDKYVFDEAIERLKESPSDEKLFMTLLTVDTHVKGGRCSYEKNGDDPENPVLFSVECFDRVFGKFMDDLKDNELLTKDTVILLTSDQLYPIFRSIPGVNFQTSFFMKPERIPFIVISEPKVEIKARQGSHVDIAATLLDFTDLDIPDYFMGKSLISHEITYPVGQNRNNGYIIIGDKFHSLLLGPKPFRTNKDGLKQFAINLPIDATNEEFKSMIELKAEEFEQENNREGALFKWYYNKYNNLSR